jgi:glycerophosphoryl diester phosphodiesterase
VAVIHATSEDHFATLDRSIPDPTDYDLALRHAPRIRFDINEPFLPLVVGYTIFRKNGKSPSFPREIVLPENSVCAIEYAIWWDWDIQHLYELEHLWIYLDRDEKVVAADASWHGGFHSMVDVDGIVPLEDNRLIVFSESGKHAFAPMIDWLLKRKPTTDKSCGKRSGRMGVHVTPLFEDLIHDRLPLNNNVVHAYLERLNFVPRYDFSQRFDLNNVVFVPWAAMFAWIPSRVNWWSDHLRETTPPNRRRPLRIAHRGASAYAQEGSQSSVEKAAELGADMVEIDIRVTADNVPVVAHDADLKRVFGVNGLISEMTLSALYNATPPNRQPILTFDEMVKLCASLELGLYLDIKEITPTAMEHVIDSLRKQGMLKYAIFGSFRPDLVAEIKASTPTAITSILFASAHLDPVSLAASVKADYVHPCWERFETPSSLLTDEWIAWVRGAGLGIVCWHEERPHVIAALNNLGVDGICSDQPELLLNGKSSLS